jgi:hypothetical protein
MQIVQRVFEDQKEESIAYDLGISRHTVNTYFGRLYRKLRVSSRTQLIVHVIAEYLALASNGIDDAVQSALASDVMRDRPSAGESKELDLRKINRPPIERVRIGG